MILVRESRSRGVIGGREHSLALEEIASFLAPAAPSVSPIFPKRSLLPFYSLHLPPFQTHQHHQHHHLIPPSTLLWNQCP